MPLADHRGLISGLSHQDRQGLVAWLNLAVEIKHTVDVVVLARDDAGPRGGADRVGAKGIVKTNAFGRELIDGRCRIESFSSVA